MNQHPARIETGGYIALVIAIGFITFYALPDGIPFLVMLSMMVATQYALGSLAQRRARNS